MSLDEVNDALLRGGAPAAKFASPGDTVRGKVVAAERRQSTDYTTGKPKTWDDGNPQMETVVTVDTGEADENGVTDRRIFFRGQFERALKEAVREHGGLRIGGTLVCRYTGDGETTRRGYSPPKLYQVKYTPPAPAAVDLGDL